MDAIHVRGRIHSEYSSAIVVEGEKFEEIEYTNNENKKTYIYSRKAISAPNNYALNISGNINAAGGLFV